MSETFVWSGICSADVFLTGNQRVRWCKNTSMQDILWGFASGSGDLGGVECQCER